MIQPNKDLRRRFDALLRSAGRSARCVAADSSLISAGLFKCSAGSDVSVAVKHEI